MRQHSAAGGRADRPRGAGPRLAQAGAYSGALGAGRPALLLLGIAGRARPAWPGGWDRAFASLREAARARRSAFSKPMACLCDARVNWAQAPGLARRRLVSTVRRIDGESGRRLACLCENARGPIP